MQKFQKLHKILTVQSQWYAKLFAAGMYKQLLHKLYNLYASLIVLREKSFHIPNLSNTPNISYTRDLIFPTIP